MPIRRIILIMTDQQRADTIGALGAGHMITPNLDRIAQESLAFREAFCPGATCTPSRAAIFTGMYAHNTGCYSFFNWGHHRTWVQDLADAGWHCASIGKMHFQPRDVAGGFEERVIVENPTSVTNWGGTGDDDWGKFLSAEGKSRPNHRHRSDPRWMEKFQAVPWHLDERLHSDVFVGDRAADWIRGCGETGPVFLQIGFPGPHEPWDPPPRLIERYAEAALPAMPSAEAGLGGKPPQHPAMQRFHAEVDHESRIDLRQASAADLDRMRRAYYAKVTLADEQIGKVIAALEERGWWKDSLVVVCSDHGEMLGEHRLPYKWLMYDPIVRVPLLIRLPQSERRTGEIRDLVSLIDLGPTVLESAGLAVPTRLEGRSLAPYLRGDTPAPRRHVFCEDNYLVMIRSATHKLVLYLGQEEGEFYDLVRDPGETANLWRASAEAERRESMMRELLLWLARSNYFNSGYKCREEGGYGRRWPAPGDAALHGENHRDKGADRS